MKAKETCIFQLCIYYTTELASPQCHAQGSTEDFPALPYSEAVLQTFLQPCLCTSFTAHLLLLASDARCHLGCATLHPLVHHHG